MWYNTTEMHNKGMFMPRISGEKASNHSCVFRIRIPTLLKEQWDDHCSKQDKNSSEVMRALMRYVIQDEMSPDVREWVGHQMKGNPDTGPKERIEVRLTPTEYKSIKSLAEAEGCSPQRWIINCVRASLTQEPQFTMETTKALWESSYQLRSIGRNLNQIAKRLNEGKESDLIVEEIKKLSGYIYDHTNLVANVQDASLSRWGIEVREVNNGEG